MSTRLSRLIQEISAISAGQNSTIDDLARITGKCRRTVFRDINVLKEGGLILEREEDTGKYVFQTPRSLSKLDLSLLEWIAVLIVLKKGIEGKNTPFPSYLEVAVSKMINTLPEAKKKYILQILDQVDIEPSINPIVSVKGSVFKEMIYAIAQKKTLQVQYTDLKRNQKVSAVICPEGIVFSNAQWQLAGRRWGTNSKIYISIGTIESLKGCKLTDSGDTLDGIKKGYRMIEGLKSRQFYIVKLVFSAAAAGEVLQSKWHETQSLCKNDDGTVLMKFRVDQLEPVIPWILRFGEDVEVLAPQSLREQIIDIAQQVVRKYN